MDDNPAANRRLASLLRETGRIEVVGRTTEAELALAEIPERDVDVLFLDIEMPRVDGFALLERLAAEPQVVFVTGHDEHAVRAFETRAVGYVMKPPTRERLERTLDKLERQRDDPGHGRLGLLLERLAAYRVSRPLPRYAGRVVVEDGPRTRLIEVAAISHVVAHAKGTVVVTPEGEHLVGHMLGELERRLDPRQWVRIHRGILVNLGWVAVIEPPAGGGLVVRLKDGRNTALPVARERVRSIKERFVL